MERQSDVADLALRLTPPANNVVIRIAEITAIEVTTDRRVQTDATDAAWIPRGQDLDLEVGDRVWMLQQGAMMIVGGRLSGGLR